MTSPIARYAPRFQSSIRSLLLLWLPNVGRRWSTRSLPGTNSPAVKRCSCNAQPSIYMLALTEQGLPAEHRRSLPILQCTTTP